MMDSFCHVFHCIVDCRVLWCELSDWLPGDQPALYRSFDVIGSLLQLNNGSQLVSGLV